MHVRTPVVQEYNHAVSSRALIVETINNIRLGGVNRTKRLTRLSYIKSVLTSNI